MFTLPENWTPIVSFIVPVFNVEDFVGKCLGSIAAQDIERVEIIVVDDGSTDGSLAVCNELAEQDARIRVLSKQNEGQGVARNYGLTKARGEFICYVDSDDWIEPDLARCVVERLQADKADFANFGADFVDSAGVVRKQIDSFEYDSLRGDDLFLDALIDRNVLSVSWNKMYRRSFLLEAGLSFPPLRVNEDLYYSRAVARAASSAVFIPAVYYHALIRDGSTSRCMSTGIFDASLRMLELSREQFADRLANPTAQRHFDAHVVKLFGYLLLQAAFRMPNFEDYMRSFDIADRAGYGHLRRRSDVLAVLQPRARLIARICGWPRLLRVLAIAAKALGLGSNVY